MPYQQYRPLTYQLLNTVKSIIIKDFPEYIHNPNKVLDLFCGRGGFTIHLSQYVTVKYVIGIDADIELLKYFSRYLDKKNIKHKTFCLDAFKFKFQDKFDIILIDPPFKFNLCHKFLSSLYKKTYLHNNTLIIIRNLVNNEVEIDSQQYNLIHNIIIGKNQLIFIKPVSLT